MTHTDSAPTTNPPARPNAIEIAKALFEIQFCPACYSALPPSGECRTCARECDPEFMAFCAAQSRLDDGIGTPEEQAADQRLTDEYDQRVLQPAAIDLLNAGHDQ